MKQYLRSFAGGETATELVGRLDLTKNQTGLARALNFIILPHGPAANRAGFAHVVHTKFYDKKSVQIPFIFSPTQSFTLEFGEEYIRFHTQAGTLLEAGQLITSITKAGPGVLTKALHGYTNGDWLFLAVTGMNEINGRFVKVANGDANMFELHDHLDLPINTSSFGTFTAGTMSRVYEVATPYAEADLFALNYTQSADVMTITHPSYQQQELRRLGALSWQLAPLAFTPSISPPTGGGATPGGPGGGTPIDHEYAITALAQDTLEESVAGTPFDCSSDLTVAGNFNAVGFTTPAVGAVRYNFYKKKNGLFGFIGQSDTGDGVRDDNIDPDMSQTPPFLNDPFQSAGNYPSAAGHFKGRRWFGGTNNAPLGLWATRAGLESNMGYSIPTRDDDRIAVRLSARQAGHIRHIIPLKELLVLTSAHEWAITSQNSDALTPTSIDSVAHGYIGASSVPPIVTSHSVLYAQASGGRIREMVANEFAPSEYRTNDICIMAPHLFDTFSITGMTYAHAPFKVGYFVRNDGLLVGVTYVPEHEVIAWHQHYTRGEFESVCAVPEDGENVLYATIKRTINGRTVRSIERQRTRLFKRLQDAFFVDAGLTFNNAIPTAVSPGSGATTLGATGVTFTTVSDWFNVGHVGLTIHHDYTEVDDDPDSETYGQTFYRRASAVITAYVSPKVVQATIEEPLPNFLQIPAGGWRITSNVISGLWHLVGEEVAILADGAVHPRVTVPASGSITLDHPASIAHVGLAYSSDLKTLPLATEQAAFGVGGMKNVNGVSARVDHSSGFFAGPSFGKLKEAKQRTTEVYGTPPDLVTGILRVLLKPNWSVDAALCIRQSDPLPLTVVALVPDTAHGG
jgi:hypothetical protein